MPNHKPIDQRKVVIKIIQQGEQFTVISDYNPQVTENILIGLAFNQVRMNQHNKTIETMKQAGQVSNVISPHTGMPLVNQKES